MEDQVIEFPYDRKFDITLRDMLGSVRLIQKEVGNSGKHDHIDIPYTVLEELIIKLLAMRDAS